MENLKANLTNWIVVRLVQLHPIGLSGAFGSNQQHRPVRLP